ncbi:uncharacterized protein LOC120105407 [Phoenix dactylifera]|uniref:Uncharacterized protein LOC120105407 n=1 Tax=Phoenix dactylifera TaxID=42345 RepID=A0A8B8ZQI4_PHODC|nr:uncharacterized protein LOC120105407 [Phoenix dactylifera]
MAEPGVGAAATTTPGKTGGVRLPVPGEEVKVPTWSEVAKGAPRQPVWSTHRISPRELQAMQRKYPEVLEVPAEELEGTRSEWRNTTVIVRSMGRSVPAVWVAKEIRRVGKLKYDVECFPLVDGFIAVRFANEEDREAALLNGPWVVAGQLLAMERWRPNFVPGAAGLGRVVVWLRLPGLPLDYWKGSTLFRIAARAGEPLAMDSFTEGGGRFGFARVKIALDCSAPLKPGIFLKGSSERSEDKFWQGFLYENLPAPCSKCGRIGHQMQGCVPMSPAMGGGGVEGSSSTRKETVGESRSEVPAKADGEGDEVGEQGVFGPWLVTNRLRFQRPANESRWGKEAAKQKGRSDPVSSPGRATPKATGDTPDSTSTSPIDLEGWQKPSKVARRRTLEKDIVAAGAGATGEGPSQLGHSSEPQTESGSKLGSSGASSSTGQAEGPKWEKAGGPGPSLLKRARAPVGGRAQVGGGQQRPSSGLLRRTEGFQRWRSRSSPPPQSAVRNRPPRVDQELRVAGGVMRAGGGTTLGRKPTRTKTGATMESAELEPAVTIGAPSELTERNRGKETGHGDGLVGAVAGGSGEGTVDRPGGEFKLDDGSLGDGGLLGDGNEDGPVTTAQTDTKGKHKQAVVLLMASIKGVSTKGSVRKEQMEDEAACSSGFGEVSHANLSGDL